MMGVDFVEASKCKGGEAPRLEQAQPIPSLISSFCRRFCSNLFSALLILARSFTPK